MRFLHKCVLALTLLPFFAHGAGQLNLLDVQGDVVYFSTTEAKAAPVPACVTAENSDLYSLPLTTDSGKAMYAMLMTAMSSGNELAITSAGDCGVVDGYERAGAVKFAQTASGNSGTDFSGTIMENIQELKYPFVNSIGQNSHEHSQFFDWFTANGKQKRSNYWYFPHGANRFQIGRKNEGSGWLTAIILPELKHNTQFTIDVHIDGVKHSFSGVSQHYPQYGSRVFMGVAPEIGSYGNDSKIAYKYPEAATVVGMGKGIPFYQSIEVYLTLDKDTRMGGNNGNSAGNHMAYDILYGQPNPNQ